MWAWDKNLLRICLLHDCAALSLLFTCFFTLLRMWTLFGKFGSHQTQTCIPYLKNRRNGEVGGGTLYHKAYLSRRVAQWNSYTTHRCTLFQPLYTCTHGQLIPLDSTATWPQFCQRNLSRLHQTPDTRHQKWVIEIELGIPPPKN
jgi:hypothetical protein